MADNEAMTSVARLDQAHEANQAVGRGRKAAPSEFDFTAQLSFLLTIGYLTREQAGALLEWFQSEGTNALPDLPGPETGPQPRMYDVLVTRIRFPPPAGATGPEDLFGDFFGAVTELIDHVADDLVRVLGAATSTLTAAGVLVHELSTL